MTTATATNPTPPANARRMSSRFPGVCVHCRARFPAGAEILFAKGYGAAHVDCNNVPAAPPVAPPALVAVLPLLATLNLDGLAAAVPAAWAVRKAAREAMDAALAAAGLCPTCKGAGSYEQRWSMDCGCVDYVTCECKGAVTVPGLRATNPEIEALCAAYDDADVAVKRAEAAEKAAQHRASILCNVAKGARVVVARGRKVPKGTTGTVIWMGEVSGGFAGRGWSTRYHRPAPARCGVKDDAGTVHWTAASNVDVIEVYADVARSAGF